MTHVVIRLHYLRSALLCQEEQDAEYAELRKEYEETCNDLDTEQAFAQRCALRRLVSVSCQALCSELSTCVSRWCKAVRSAAIDAHKLKMQRVSARTMYRGLEHALHGSAHACAVLARCTGRAGTNASMGGLFHCWPCFQPRSLICYCAWHHMSLCRRVLPGGVRWQLRVGPER